MVQDVPRDARDVPEILESAQMPRPKKDKQAMGLVRMSPRNSRFGKLSMEEKGKAVNIETDEEEEDLQALIDEIEANERGHVASVHCNETSRVHSSAKRES